MSDLLLPFALRISDDQYVSAEEVPRGLKCNCVCPGCGNPVQARQGTERIWHFSHAKAGDCDGAYEKSVHETAKQLLRERKVLFLPALVVTDQAVDIFSRRITETETIHEPKTLTLETLRPGLVIENVAPDLVGSLNGRKILIEITVFHRLMPEKQERLKKTGLAVLEIDLSNFRSKQASRTFLEEALFETADNRQWVWHPEMAAAKARISERLRLKLLAAEEERAEWSRKEEERIAAQEKNRLLFEPIRNHQNAPVSSDIAWRASFPQKEQRSQAMDAFCERHGLSKERVNTIFESITHRGELEQFSPRQLAQAWANQLEVSSRDLFQYFKEGGYTL